MIANVQKKKPITVLKCVAKTSGINMMQGTVIFTALRDST
jgi:hypothetical protein